MNPVATLAAPGDPVHHFQDCSEALPEGRVSAGHGQNHRRSAPLTPRPQTHIPTEQKSRGTPFAGTRKKVRAKTAAPYSLLKHARMSPPFVIFLSRGSATHARN